MKQIIIMALEPIAQRYTEQWYYGLPKLLAEETYIRGRDIEIITLDGESIGGQVTTGAFLDFVGTNVWKSTQLAALAKLVQEGSVKDDAAIIWTDAWNPCILQARYMFDLMEKPVKMYGIWHAGSYDPNDFLGRIRSPWTVNTEKALYEALDFNMFATNYHVDLFMGGVFDNDLKSSKVLVSGQPHNLLHETLTNRPRAVKKRQVIFPHRDSVEKQPSIFHDLARSMPDVKFVFPLDNGAKPSKEEYYQLLEESTVMFSANLQETLGISAMEAVLLDTIPFLPTRLSYREMYSAKFLYPDNWTATLATYQEHKESIVKHLYYMLDNAADYEENLERQKERLEEYLYPDAWMEVLFK